jgi:hypothetical protein
MVKFSSRSKDAGLALQELVDSGVIIEPSSYDALVKKIEASADSDDMIDMELETVETEEEEIEDQSDELVENVNDAFDFAIKEDLKKDA